MATLFCVKEVNCYALVILFHVLLKCMYTYEHYLATQIKTADSAHILPGALSVISVLCMDLRMRLYAYMHNEATEL